MTVEQTNIGDCKRPFLMVSPNKIMETEPKQRADIISNRWHALKTAIESTGAGVLVLKDQNSNPNDTDAFCRDSYITVGQDMLFPEALVKHSRPTYSDFFNYHASKHVKILKGSNFEGGNVIIHEDKKIIFFGIEHQIHIEEAKKLLKSIRELYGQQWRLIPIPLTKATNADAVLAQKVIERLLLRLAEGNNIDESLLPNENSEGGLYHLDLMMSDPLPNGEFVVCPEGTTKDGFRNIRQAVGKENIIEISLKEALKGNANFVTSKSNIIISQPSERLMSEFRERGYGVLTAKDFGQERFGFSESEVHCLTRRL